MKKYELLAGLHNEGGRTYSVGEIIETDCDLLQQNKGSAKFRLLGAADVEIDDNISAMSVPELKAFAAEHEFDIGDATLKADIAATIRRAAVNVLALAGA